MRPALRLSILARAQADRFLGRQGHTHDQGDRISRIAQRDVAQQELLKYLGELKAVLANSKGPLRVAGPEAVGYIVAHVESIHPGSRSAKDNMETVSREIFSLQKTLISFSDQKVIRDALPPKTEHNFFVRIFNKMTYRTDTRFPSRVSEEEKERLRGAAAAIAAEHDGMLESVRRVRRSVERGEPVTEMLSRKGLAEYDRQLRGEAAGLERLVTRVTNSAKEVPSLSASVSGLARDLDDIVRSGQTQVKQFGGTETKAPIDYQVIAKFSGLMDAVASDIPKDVKSFMRDLEPGGDRSTHSLAAWDRTLRLRRREFEKTELALLTVEEQARSYLSEGDKFRDTLAQYYTEQTRRVMGQRELSKPVVAYAEIHKSQQKSIAMGQPIYVPGQDGGGAIYGPNDKHYSGLKAAIKRGYTAALSLGENPAIMFMRPDGSEKITIAYPLGKKSDLEFSRGFERLVRYNLKPV